MCLITNARGKGGRAGYDRDASAFSRLRRGTVVKASPATRAGARPCVNCEPSPGPRHDTSGQSQPPEKVRTV
jgi:hypothetical protein